MNRKALQILSIFSAAALVSGAFETSSQARSVLASAGRPVLPGDYGCFLLDASSVANSCSTTRYWETPLAVDASGWYSVTVSAEGGLPTANVGCLAVGISQDARSSVWISPRLYLPRFGLPAPTMTLNAVFVPNAGGLFVNCEVQRNGRVNTFNW